MRAWVDSWLWFISAVVMLALTIGLSFADYAYAAFIPAFYLLFFVPWIESRSRLRNEQLRQGWKEAMEEWEFWILNGRPKPHDTFRERLEQMDSDERMAVVQSMVARLQS